jgi:(2Fe-2S) ferredoxin
VTESFRNAIRDRGLSEEVLVVPTGCHGMCEMGPIVVVYPEGTFYCRVQKSDVAEIVEEHIYKGRPVQRLMYSGSEDMPFIPHYKEIPFYGKQHRIALANCGYINPDNIAPPRKATKSMSSATPTRGTPGLSWTGPSSRATPTASSRA